MAAPNRVVALVATIGIGIGCTKTVHQPVGGLRLGQVVSSVTSYDTIDGRSHECVGKARLQRNPKAPSQAPTDPSIATTTDPQWQRYQRCLDERRGSEAGQRACGILAPVNVTSDADLALRCRGVSELRVLPALTVRTLRIDPPASMGTGAAVILILGGLLLVGAAAGAAELSQL